MEEVEVASNDLVKSCQTAFAVGGILSHALQDFIVREPQAKLAEAVAYALQNQQTLVAEAGTGTGKTFAYLIPAILSGKKVLVATATKTLQDQLVQKDLPLLIKALGKAVQVQNLKGRANYICTYRTSLYAKEGQFVNSECASDLAKVYAKLPRLNTGERGEISELREDSPAWPYVTSTVDNCLGRECADMQKCFLMKARKRAMEANLVVINHHLFFADARLKQDGFGELLPNFDAVIFDEAHKVFEVASHFHSTQFSTRKLSYLLDDIIRNWPIIDLVNQPFKEYSYDLDKLIDRLLILLRNEQDRISWQRLQRIEDFHQICAEIVDFIIELLEYLPDEAIAENQGLQRCKSRLQELQTLLHEFLTTDVAAIRWVEVFKHTVVMHCTPFSIADKFSEQMAAQNSAFIFTSATLTVNDTFKAFLAPLGVSKAELLNLPSPFAYQQQTLLYLPRSIPDPKSADYYSCLLEKVLPVLNACGGRTFFLFTSHSALRKTAKLLAKKISYPLLIQGDEPKENLLNKFKQLKNAILLGSATFWEGVDVKGESLSCVIIDKIPFASPRDPVTQGRMAHIAKSGQSGFDELSLPSAVLALKQGVGRLIRDINDKGVLVIGDPRLLARNYARAIFTSLPDLPITRDEQKVLQFIQDMALK